jgi:hypothetical protein
MVSEEEKMRTVGQAVIEQAEADRKKHGYKNLYICSANTGSILQINEILEDGFTNSNGVIFSFAPLTPIIPISNADGTQMCEKESGIHRPNKGLIIPKAN